MRDERSRHCCRIRGRGELKLLTHRHPQLYHLIIRLARPQICQAESVTHRQRRLCIRRQATAEHAHKLGQPEAPQLRNLREDVLAHRTREPRRAAEDQPAILDVLEALCDRHRHASRPPLQHPLRTLRPTVPCQRTLSDMLCAAGARHRLLAARRCNREAHRAREERHQATASAADGACQLRQPKRPARLSEPPHVRLAVEARPGLASSRVARRPQHRVGQHQQAAAAHVIQRPGAQRLIPCTQHGTGKPTRKPTLTRSASRSRLAAHAAERRASCWSYVRRCRRPLLGDATRDQHIERRRLIHAMTA